MFCDVKEHKNKEETKKQKVNNNKLENKVHTSICKVSKKYWHYTVSYNALNTLFSNVTIS